MKTIFAALTAVVLTAGIAHAQDQWYDRQNEIGIFDKSVTSQQGVVIAGPGFTRDHGQAPQARSVREGRTALFGAVESPRSPFSSGRDASGGWPGFQ